MRCVIPSQYRDRLPSLLSKVGYIYHCQAANQPCYHRQLHSSTFPRFHLVVTPNEHSDALELHIDQYSANHRGNHGEAWAYEGSRVRDEIAHILSHMDTDHVCVGSVNHASLGFVGASARNLPLSRCAQLSPHKPWRWQAHARM